MLLGKLDHGFVKHKHIVYTTFFGAFTFVMNDFGFRKIVVFITTQYQSITQINVFAIHEKILVQQTNLIQGRLTQPHIRTRQHINGVDLMLVQITAMVFAEYFTRREKGGQTKYFIKSHFGCRQTAFTFRKKIPLSIHHIHTQTATFGTNIHKSYTF